MKPLFDNFTPFSIERVPEIRRRREIAIEHFFENRDNPKTRITARKPKEVRLDSGAKAALDKLPPELRKQIMEAMKYADGRKHSPGKESSP